MAGLYLPFEEVKNEEEKVIKVKVRGRHRNTVIESENSDSIFSDFRLANIRTLREQALTRVLEGLITLNGGRGADCIRMEERYAKALVAYKKCNDSQEVYSTTWVIRIDAVIGGFGMSDLLISEKVSQKNADAFLMEYASDLELLLVDAYKEVFLSQ